MSIFSIRALDPLVLRDGRPNDGRSESRTLNFPLPSTVAGVIRGALGNRGTRFDPSLIPTLRENVRLRGPLLAREGNLLVPAPLDALLLDREGQLTSRALVPIRLPDGASTSDVGAGRSLVGLDTSLEAKAKPLSKAPAFWAWSSFVEWLQFPGAREETATRALLAGAIVSLVKEERIHVGMGPSGTADDGKLFATEGLRTAGVLFDHEKHSSRPEKEKHTDLEFLVDLQVEDRALGQLSAVLRPLGGERRLTSWTATSHQLPGIPDWLSKHVEQTEKPVVRVVLLTPAHIQESSGPRKLDKEGIATTIAARVDRPLTISGWDMAKGQPKKTRRLAASGSVFWVQLSGTAKDRLLWLKEIWMGNVSDDPQLARDGFGLAAVGIGSAP